MFKIIDKFIFIITGFIVMVNFLSSIHPVYAKSDSSPASTSSTAAATSPCLAPLKSFEKSYTQVFPLISSDMNDSAIGKCNPAVWDQNIAFLFILKALVILNWLADVTAVLATVYAGILYISGFANENNVKQAKNILISCYVGLAIVFSARLIFNEVLTTTTASPNNNNTFNLDQLYPSPSTGTTSNTNN
jgi:hypothetical protein